MRIVQLAEHLAQSKYDSLFLTLLLSAELILCLLILRYVSYTEIDWEAYMQEVRMWWVGGETDYTKIYGATGPLVYPAGFLYLFAVLRDLTGESVEKAQPYFLVFYLATQLAVLLLYQAKIQSEREKGWVHVWSWRIAAGLTCLSKRLHSIFLLRLFNDGPTMLLLYVSVWFFSRHSWNAGCVVFSLAVSLKMNVLLFAPGLLLLLLQASSPKTVVLRLGLACALPQLILGAPFLLTHPISYLRKAFELDRVFFYKWTVNWKVRTVRTV